MFGLVRKAFWASLLLLVIPIDDSNSDRSIDVASPVQAIATVQDVVADMRMMCERKPDVCVRGRELMQTVGERAREGARVAYKMLDEKLAADDGKLATGSIAKGE